MTPEWQCEAFGRFLLTADEDSTDPLEIRNVLVRRAVRAVRGATPEERLERIWEVLDGFGVRHWGENHLRHMWRVHTNMQERLAKSRETERNR